jgi:pyridinium-3,5-bisthiocarboxylic acid mononucleotide nickel chelatase
MWYIDMPGGFSPAGLFVALVSLIGDKKQTYIEACRSLIMKAPGFFHHTFSREEFLDLVYIKEQCKGMTPLQRKDLVYDGDTIISIVVTIVSLSGEERINYFDFYLFFLLIVLMEKMNAKSKFYILSPRIGTGSSESALALLRGIMIMLDPVAMAVPPMSAAFCHYYKDRVINVGSGSLTSVMYVPVPFSDDKVVQLFEYNSNTRTTSPVEYEYDVVSVLETNIDDSTPEVISGVMTYILDQGALDYTVTPVMMKKGRNGFHIQVLCRKDDCDKFAEILLHQTSSFGLRMYEARRTKLRRRMTSITTEYGNITVKLGYCGDHLIKAVPEFDDLNRIATSRNIPLFNLYNEIMGELKKGIDCFAKDGKIDRL